MSALTETNVTPHVVGRKRCEPKRAHVIGSDAEAIAIAKEIAAELEKGASDRDRDRILPHREIALFSQSGLWGILVPKDHGGAGVSNITLAEVVAITSAADPSIGQIPQNHHCIVDAIRLVGSQEQKQHYFAEVLNGHRFGNAFSEAGGKHVLDINTRLQTSRDGYSLSGRKFYSSGALFAQSIPVWALDEQGRGVLVIVPRDRAGLTVIDDWSGFGQRTTASGTVTLDKVHVEDFEILHFYRAHEQPTGAGALAQIIQVAVDLGIGRAAVMDTIAFVRDRARAWVVNDPLQLIAPIAMATKHLGIGITASTSFEHPYTFARRLSTADHHSKGRVGWNIVTSYLESGAKNIGQSGLRRHDNRYEVAEEYVEVLYKLFEGSWEDGAVIRDREKRVFTRPEKVHEIGHKGKYFAVPGYHLCEPSPQRTPLLYQAGASGPGKSFAARHAECVFTASPIKPVLKSYVADVRRQAAIAARDPRKLYVYNLCTILVDETDAKAQAKLEEYRQYASYDGALVFMSGWSGIDFGQYAPADLVKKVQTNAIISVVDNLASGGKGWTIEELARWGGDRRVRLRHRKRGGQTVQPLNLPRGAPLKHTREPAARHEPAHRIASDAEALAIARQLAREFSEGSAERDRERLLPFNEVERFSQSGLWGISVPKEYGGAGVSVGTLAEATAIISAADANLGQIPQNHYYMVEAIRLAATEQQKRFYFARVLDGERFGNAFTEIGTKTPTDFKTTVVRSGDDHLLNGQKFYSTGTLFAHWIVAVARDGQDRPTLVFVKRGTRGLTLVDDWTSFGQRTTGIGTTKFDNIRVTPFEVVPHQEVFDQPTPMGPLAQIIHAAVDVGIARAALTDAIEFTRRHARPWIETSYGHGREDPHVIAAVGDLVVRVNAANALLERAGAFVDRATASPSEESVAAASIAVAEAKALSTEVALHVSSKLFELTGSRSTLREYNFDRHWRNARTHTLHDPVRYKYINIGNYFLNAVKPPRHGAL
jgi:SfnB family sulfur acquisition oxidoreductase